MLHVFTTTFIVFSDKSVPVHQAKSYPVLVGFINVNPFSTSYVVGLVPNRLPQSKLYKTLYVITSITGVITFSSSFNETTIL